MVESSRIAARLIRAADALRGRVDGLRFSAPVDWIYNPLDYAWAPHCEYLSRYGHTCKRILFLGMNPGPFGMMQTGVPFGEIHAVRDWLGITALVHPPRRQHPKRPIAGFHCTRSEVSGRRLWGLFAKRFGSAEHFFARHFVANFCPLVFLEAGGKNRTPDQLPAGEKTLLLAACREHLHAVVEALRPEWIIGVGNFAARQAREVVDAGSLRVGQILHPSPASPAANRDWAGAATRQLHDLKVWPE